MHLVNQRRRVVLLAGAAGTLTAPMFCRAQASAMPRIGWMSADVSTNRNFFDAFREGMRDLGYVEGRNLVIDARWGERSAERADRLAVELVASKPLVIVTQAGQGTFPVVRAGATMPVVFGVSGDPVVSKLVASYARPGGNFTGVAFLSLELVGKRMQLAKEMLPGLKRVAIVCQPEHPGQEGELRASEAAAKALGIAIDYFPVRSAADIETAFAAMPRLRSEAAVMFPDAITFDQRARIADLAAKNRIPTISGWASYADAGILMTYGPALRDSYRRLATYVDKILKGAKPAELPVELPTTFEMVVNLKTAAALGIKLPQTILLQATRVIE